MNFILRILRTIGYVTCLPAAKTKNEEDLNGLAQFLPVAGLVIGACLCAVDFALSQAPVDKLLEAGILTVFWLVLTNGLHFDGLMDTADGIFSHQNRERMLEIMQDSRVGNFGVLAGVSVFLLKFLSLSTIPSAWHIPVLLLVPACGRWAETFAIGAFPYAKSEGKGKIWHDSANYPNCLFTASIAPALVALGTVFLGYWQVWLICASTIVSGIVAAYWLAHKLGGHTGDTYGCVVELSETGGLIACALALACH